MISIVLAVAGAVLGGLTAKRRGGKPADIAQYAAVYAIIGAVVGVIATIVLARIGQ